MNQRSLNVLEFPKIIDLLKGFCVTGAAKEAAGALTPLCRVPEIEDALNQTDEALGMVLRGGRPPLSELAETDPLVKRAEMGAVLSMGELLRIASMLRIVRDMLAWFDEDTGKDSVVRLKSLFTDMDPCEFLEEAISKKILSEDEMADNASRELFRIRREIISKNSRITEKLNQIVSSSANEKILQERLVTIRNNRYVVPVKQEYRSRIPGIVLDRSASGATLFVEPLSVVELNNDLKMLAVEEEKEINRILKQLAEEVAAEKELLISDFALLTELDFIFAKAKYALDIGGQRVALSTQGPIHLLRARHPLLDAKTAVPSDITLDENLWTMVITGPNTGGKTVTLKTIGLLCLMVQAGLFVPVREGSSMRIFKEVFADIGDEQSIEQSLSTFSAHMTNIVAIMAEADAHSLVLFDELGAGTDPTEGAALAIAILDALHQRQCLTIATTHYSELKEYALVTPGIVNASVEFDVATLSPTYRLLIGFPGKSNAFEIAARLGLPDTVIEAAKGTIEKDAIAFEETLGKLVEDQRRAEADAQTMRDLKTKAEEAWELTRKQREEAQKESQRLLEKAQEESARIVRETKEKTDAIYREIRLIQESTETSLGDNKKLESLRKEMAGQEKSLYAVYKKKLKKPKKNSGQHVPQKIEKGMAVHILSLHQNGDVLELLPKDRKVLVQVGMLKLKVEQDDVVPVAREERPRRPAQKHIASVDRHVMETRLDLRGNNGEEALFKVDKMISDAIVSGTHELMIVHGKGTGKLRQVIHEYLKDNPNVESFRIGAPHEGGGGVTIVTL
jgi:DNA mismatch repair protein MutS2